MNDHFIKKSLAVMSKAQLIDLAKKLSKDQVLDSDFFDSRGGHFIKRVINLDDKQASEELAFSNAIKRHHELFDFTELMGGEECLKGAFTMFQWLTTNVGNSVLEEALKSVGKKIISIEVES